jgi:hypothetical protein
LRQKKKEMENRGRHGEIDEDVHCADMEKEGESKIKGESQEFGKEREKRRKRGKIEEEGWIEEEPCG